MGIVRSMEGRFQVRMGGGHQTSNPVPAKKPSL